MEDELTSAQVAEILNSRIAIYAFLSQVYRHEVTRTFLERLSEELAGPAEDVPESDGNRLLRAYMQRIARANLGKVETELRAEYAALFLNASAQPVHPFESVYTSPGRLLMQQARDDVVAEYSREGLGRAGELKEPEDHIAIELEFMGFLCQRASEALEAGDSAAAAGYLQKQKAFLTKHLLNWVPAFCQDLARTASSDFFRGIAGITEEHLGLELETIDELQAAIES